MRYKYPLLRDWRFVSGLTIACFGLGYLVRIGTQMPVFAQSGRAEFTATMSTKRYDAKGTEYANFSTIIAQRKDGSTSTFREGFQFGQTSKNASIRLVDELKEIHAYHGVKSKFTTRLSPERAQQLSAPVDSACPAVAGSVQSTPQPGTLFGFGIMRKIQHVSESEGKTVVIENWLAPALDCLPMRKTVQLSDASGAVIHREVDEVANVALGQPTPALFTLPGDFVERSPSEVYLAEAARLGDTACVNCPRKVLSNSDTHYFKNKFE
jgi:hypothetical protein